MHEIDGPDLIQGLWHRQSLGLRPYQAFAGPDLQIELQLLVYSVHAFMVTAKAIYIAKVQIAQTKTPVAMVVRQAKQPIGNFVVLCIHLALIPIARFADPKCHAGNPYGQPSFLNRFDGHLPSARSPHHFFSRASATILALIFSSRYIFLRRWFSSSSYLSRDIKETSIPPYLDRRL